MLKEGFNFVCFSKFMLEVRYNYHFSIFQDNFGNQHIRSLFFHKVLLYFVNIQRHWPNFAKRSSFSNICANVLTLRQSLRILLLQLTVGSLLFVFWLLVLSTICFVIKVVFTLILALIFITFIYSIHSVLKFYIFINAFIQNLGKIFKNVLYILFRILWIFIFCFVCFAIILLICIFVNLFDAFRNIVNLFYILFSHSVLMLTEV